MDPEGKKDDFMGKKYNEYALTKWMYQYHRCKVYQILNYNLIDEVVIIQVFFDKSFVLFKAFE